jgi:hypothetical protein
MRFAWRTVCTGARRRPGGVPRTESHLFIQCASSCYRSGAEGVLNGIAEWRGGARTAPTEREEPPS